MTLVQATLFDRRDLVLVPAARRTDPGTSTAAAAGARELAGRHCQLILDMLRQAGVALSAEQVADRSGELTALQVARRIAGLLRAGAIAVGQDLVPTASGRMGRTYCIAAAGGQP